MHHQSGRRVSNPRPSAWEALTLFPSSPVLPGLVRNPSRDVRLSLVDCRGSADTLLAPRSAETNVGCSGIAPTWPAASFS
jgi:hypothetical protein